MLQNHSQSHITTNQQNTVDNGLYRASYHTSHDYIYGTQNAASSTGAVPRTQQWHGTQARSEEPNKQSTRPYQQLEDGTSNNQIVSVTIETQKDAQKDAKNAKSMTKTYHTIKDMISSRFKGKDNDGPTEKSEESGLNNVTEELRKSIRSVDKLPDETEDSRLLKKPAGEQGIYGKPRTDQQSRQEGITMQQYNNHVLQQQMLHSQVQLHNQIQQQYQQNQQFKNQSYAGQIQIAQSRSQEILAPRPHQQITQDSVYYHGASYGATPQRPVNRYGIQTPDQTYVMMHHSQFAGNTRETYNERCVDDRRPIEPRSPQQIERDNIRRKSFEARRAASQPQLAFDDETKSTTNDTTNSSNLLGQVTPLRRGSHGNLIESCIASRLNNQESEKDSDDGGFIQRQNFQERNTDKANETTLTNEEKSSDTYSKDDPKVAESLTGAPRKKLEGEIGKIEGVYNVGQRIRTLNGENLEMGDKRGKCNVDILPSYFSERKTTPQIFPKGQIFPN